MRKIFTLLFVSVLFFVSAHAQPYMNPSILSVQGHKPTFMDVQQSFNNYWSAHEPNETVEAENAEDVAYYLGKNPKEAERIVSLPTLSQVREIGKLEAKLLAEPAKPKTPSKAPAPITPLTGAAPVTTDVPSENDEIGTWIKRRSKQVHGKR